MNNYILYQKNDSFNDYTDITRACTYNVYVEQSLYTYTLFCIFDLFPGIYRQKRAGKQLGEPQLNKSGPEVIKLFSCSTQLRPKFILLINVKMPTIVGILTFISRINN